MTPGLVGAFLIAFLSVWLLSRPRMAWMLDHPNARSLHAEPVSRGGGLGLLLGFLCGIALAPPLPLPAVPTWLGLVLLVLVSFIDDAHGLPVIWRLLTQSLAVALALFGFDISWSWWPLLLPVGVWCVNLYNFMDGADGLAASMAVFGFTALGLAVFLVAGTEAAGVYALLALAALGFLRWNLPRARIFLGDTGSTALGYLGFALSLHGLLRGWFSLWLPVAVFSPFLLDSTVTLLRRLLRGEAVWRAHREHFYQLVVMRGGSHRRLLYLAWWLMAASAATGLLGEWALRALESGTALAVTALLSVALGLIYTARIRMELNRRND